MSNVRSDALDEYNPFDTHQSSAMLSASDNPPSNGVLSDQTRAIQEMERKQMELDARSAELDRREREQQMRVQVDQSTIKNWPPLCKFCPCTPCFRVDFDVDFNDDRSRKLARFAHYLWYAYSGLLLINLFGTLAYMISYNNSLTNALFGSSILVLVILPIYSFLTWNRPLYKALKKDSSLSFFTFFLFFAIQILLSTIQALGIDYLGSCGWINGFTACKSSKGVCVFMLIIASGFTLITVAFVYLILKIHSHFRGTNGSFDKVKQEVVTDISQSVSARNSQP